jgi:hypothetical protein
MRWKLIFVFLAINALIVLFVVRNKRGVACRAYSDVNHFCVKPDVERQLFFAMIRDGDADAAYKLGRHLNFAVEDAKDGYELATICNLIAALQGHHNACQGLRAGIKDIRRLLLTSKAPNDGFRLNDELQLQFFNFYWRLLGGVIMKNDVAIREMQNGLAELGVHAKLFDADKISALLKGDACLP